MLTQFSVGRKGLATFLTLVLITLRHVLTSFLFLDFWRRFVCKRSLSYFSKRYATNREDMPSNPAVPDTSGKEQEEFRFWWLKAHTFSVKLSHAELCLLLKKFVPR